ncbi:MAG: DNA-directed RNA polymerase specialized sigma24 family protein [Candidatus Azotimanducaceae bacterium]|jgi:DNA-directed RNA polymerase specialized sigma24 family protein
MSQENSDKDGGTNLSADIANSEQREYENINEILDTLPSDVRTAFLMHRREELSYDKIAIQMNI